MADYHRNAIRKDMGVSSRAAVVETACGLCVCTRKIEISFLNQNMRIWLSFDGFSRKLPAFTPCFCVRINSKNRWRPPAKTVCIPRGNVRFLHDPQRRRAREHEPKAVGALGEPYRDPERGRKTYLALAVELPPGVAGNSDRLAFRKLVRLEALSRQGITKVSEEQLLRSYLAAFGMTPCDRNRVTVSPVQPPLKDDPLAEFLDRGRLHLTKPATE
jgi:hypothetical protein